MAEELRFFVRIGLYTALITSVYWFVSYEIAGSLLLGFLAAAVVVFVAPAARLLREPGRRDTSGLGAEGAAPGGRVARFVGFSEPEQPRTLAVADEPLPHASIWPLLGAVAALLVGLGLLFGGWFWAPGAAAGAVVAWRWLTQIDA